MGSRSPRVCFVLRSAPRYTRHSYITMKFLIVFLALVVYVSAECGTLQRLKVKRQWAKAFGQGGERENFGLALWSDLFQEHPDTRGFFDAVNGQNEFSPEFSAHAQRVLGGIDICISLLDDQPTLDTQLAHLKAQHAERGIGAENFEFMKASLGRTLAGVLGRHFDKQSWASCYDLIAAGIA